MEKPKSAAQILVSLLEPRNPEREPKQLHRLLDMLKEAIGAEFSMAGVKEAKTLREVFSRSSANLHNYSAFSAPFDDAMGADVDRILKECRIAGNDGERWKAAYTKLCERMSAAVGRLRTRKPELSKAFEVLKAYCGDCCSMLEGAKSRSEFDFYLGIDDVLHAETGPKSVDTTVLRLEKAGMNIGKEEREWVGWYLRAVRAGHRQDMTIEVEQEKCEKCGNMKGEGEPCPTCARAQKALEGAQEAERKGDWGTAKSKAEEVLKVWKGHSEADRIEKAADAALRKIEADKAKVRQAEGQISDALRNNPPDIGKARALCKEARELHGFDTAKWEREIREKEREKERQEREEAEREARVAALGRFKEGLGEEDWAKAAGMIPELVRLGAGKEADFRKQIDEAKANKEVRLSSKCDGALKKAEVALSGPVDNANPEDILEELNKAKQALKELGQSFKNAPGLKEFRTRIDRVEKRLPVVREEVAVLRLAKAEWVKAQGSAGGEATVLVQWKGSAKKWCVFREERGGKKEEVLKETAETTWRDSAVKAGTEYRYGVAPMAQTGKGWRANAKPEKVAWSDPVVCLLGVKGVLGRGLGIPGGTAAVSLTWELPTIPGGLDVSVEVVREPAFQNGRTVRLKGGGSRWTDTEVRVGGAYRYTVTLITGDRRTPGARSETVVVEKAERPPAVGELKVQRRRAAEFSVAWKWRGSATKAEWSVEPGGGRGVVVREAGAETGGAVVYGVRGGRGTIRVTSLCAVDSVELKGDVASCTFGEPGVVECQLLKPKWWSGGAWVLRFSCKEGALPSLSVRLGKDEEPYSVEDGEDLGQPTGEGEGPREAELRIPTNRKGYVRVFLGSEENPAEWRIRQPEENRIK